MKENNNLLTHDLWSAKEYNNTTTWINDNSQSKIESSNKFSTIGEKSLKYKHTRSEWGDYVYTTISNIQTNTQYTLSFDAYIRQGILNVRLANDSRLNTLSQVEVPSSDKIQHISLSCTTPSSINALIIQLFDNNSCVCYLDNFMLI